MTGPPAGGMVCGIARAIACGHLRSCFVRPAGGRRRRRGTRAAARRHVRLPGRSPCGDDGSRERRPRLSAAACCGDTRHPGGAGALVRRSAGIRYVEPVHARVEAAEPALFSSPAVGTPYEWQFAAAHVDAVPESVLRAASAVTIAVIDTGADLTAPDLAAKSPRTHNLRTGKTDVEDVIGHGTFVSSLAAGSVTNSDGMAGFGGDAKLLVIKAGGPDGSFSDVDEAN